MTISDGKKSRRKKGGQPLSSTDTPAITVQGAPVAKVGQIRAGDIRKGTKLLYPGGKIAVVSHSVMFTPTSSDVPEGVVSMIVVFFDGTLGTGIAIHPDAPVYEYRDNPAV